MRQKVEDEINIVDTNDVDLVVGGEGWEGGIFIYSCSARRISFESDCFYGM